MTLFSIDSVSLPRYFIGAGVGLFCTPLPNVKKKTFDMHWYYLSIHRVWKILDWCHVPPHCE